MSWARSAFALKLFVLAALSLGTGPTAGVCGEPARIVALGGSITEILYDLGMQDAIVGVDSTSLYPPEALRRKASVGYVRALSAEGVLSLKPSLVLAIAGAGPPDALDLMRAAGAPLTIVPDDPTPDGVAKKVEIIGDLVDAAPAAAALNRKIAEEFKALASERALISKPVRVLFVLSFSNGRSLVGGRNTAAAGMIELAGAINAAAGVDGYKTMTDEAITAAAPDFVLMMQNDEHHVDPQALFSSDAYAATPAAKSKALVTADGLLLLGFGPRTPEAARMLIKALYPDLAPAHQ